MACGSGSRCSTRRGAEELDFAGPWEVLAAWSKQWPDDGVEVFTVADTPEPVRCAKGLRVAAGRDVGERRDRSTCSSTRAAGARGRSSATRPSANATARPRRRRHADDQRLHRLARLRRRRLLDGRPATTYWDALELLALARRDIDVRADDRFVDDGDVVTAAGVSAGIDMALHLVARLHSVGARARGPPLHPVRPGTTRLGFAAATDLRGRGTRPSHGCEALGKGSPRGEPFPVKRASSDPAALSGDLAQGAPLGVRRALGQARPSRKRGGARPSPSRSRRACRAGRRSPRWSAGRRATRPRASRRRAPRPPAAETARAGGSARAGRSGARSSPRGRPASPAPRRRRSPRRGRSGRRGAAAPSTRPGSATRSGTCR